MYHYWGFGLTIASEIAFPELLPIAFSGPPDVTISVGIAPKALTGSNVQHKVGYSISPDQYLLNLLNIANYYACNGNTIIIEPLAAADDKSIRLFLLSGVMAAILHQRDRVMLHASAIKYQDGVVLFCGPANSGKSALVSKLKQQGYTLFSDDVCVLQLAANGLVEAVPSYPMLKLWEDSFEKLGMQIPPATDKVRPNLPKYSLFYHDEFDTVAKPVKQLYLMSRNQQATGISAKPMSAMAGFKIAHDNIFHRLQIYPMKKQASNFTIISKLTATLPVYSAAWDDDKQDQLHVLTDLVLLNLQSNG